MNAKPAAIVARIEEELGPLVANHQEFEMLFKAIRSGEHAYDIVPSVLPRMIRQESWMRRYDRNTGKPYRYEDARQFVQFIEDEPPQGLGTTVDNLRRYLREGSQERVAFEQAVDRGRGGNNNPHGRAGKPEEGINHTNGMVDSDEQNARTIPIDVNADRKPRKGPIQGNTIENAVRRLRRAAEKEPEKFKPIYDRLMASEISANRAMIEAGFRHPTISVPVEPQLATQMIVRHFKGDTLTDLIRRLADWAGCDLVRRDGEVIA